MSLSSIGNVLHETIGLNVESIGERTLERAVEERMAARHLDQARYLNLLQRSAEELQQLIEAVVVSETWFFRDAQAFEALARFVRAERPGDRTVRVLSAPCATGEEPYSLVMALLDAGLERSRIAVEAVDVSERVLAIAREGCYGRNSFRGNDLSFRDRYFRHEGRHYSIREEVRSLVRFARGNLVDLQAEQRFDAIFCRNVLIYFSDEMQRSVLATLERLLVPDGMLWVGPAETYLAANVHFASTGRAMAMGLRKAAGRDVAMTTKEVAAPKRPARYAHKTAPGTARALPPAPLRKAAAHPVRTTHRQEPRAEKSRQGPDLADARQLADGGRLKEAAAVCEAHIAHAGPSAEAFYMLALISDASGDAAGAARYYGQVVYLDPDHADALQHLSLIARQRGDEASAARYRERARRVEERTRR
jgi:chemotaxis protein methyltransferase WspC